MSLIEARAVWKRTDCSVTRLDRKSGSAGMPRPISYDVFCLEKNIYISSYHTTGRAPLTQATFPTRRSSDLQASTQRRARERSVAIQTLLLVRKSKSSSVKSKTAEA